MKGNFMIPCRENALLLILALLEKIEIHSCSHRVGRKRKYSDMLFLKAAVIMSVKRFSRVFELLTTLNEPTADMATLRTHLTQDGFMPTRRTFERRLRNIADLFSSIIARLGSFLVTLLAVWEESGGATAMDSTVLRAKDNAVWHKKHQEKGEIPGWTKSGWHGWVYGWKLHVTATVGDIWIPLSARLTCANVYDGTIGQEMIRELPTDTRFVLGDQHYRTSEMEDACYLRGMELVATQSGKYPHSDAGVEVRRIFHQLRSKAIENFNEHFKSIFDTHCDVPTKGKRATTRFALSAVLVYQLGLWARHDLGLPVNRGLKPFLRAV
ncbi:MAG: hypothetical protein EOP06_32685 [Proteobacteria bacterium]|nr:MAG: hypothetical protein EOP06_32685 [Pseudomonadota bacterium]